MKPLKRLRLIQDCCRRRFMVETSMIRRKAVILMRHSLMAHIIQTTQSDRTTSATPQFWQIIGITAVICLGFASEGLAQTTVSPTSLTYYAVQGGSNPPNKTITVSR